MPIVFTCPTCRYTFSVSDDLAGRTATCNKCGAKFTIPGGEVAPPVPMVRPNKPATNVSRQRPAKSSQALTWVLVCIMLILVGGATSAYLLFRDTWEQDNKSKVLEMKQTADVYAKNDLLVQAKAEYQALINYVGDRQIKDAQIVSAVRNAKARFLDIDLQEKKTRAKQVEETDKKLKESEKEAARLAKEKEIADKKKHAEEITRLRQETIQQGEIIKKLEENEDAKEAEQVDQERLEADKLLAQAKQNEREATAHPRPTGPSVVASKPSDTTIPAESGEECPLCLGLKKGNITINEPHIWYDMVQTNVIVRIIPKLLFTPSEQGQDPCPACGGKGRGIGIPSTASLTRDLPDMNFCKNCEGFCKLLKYKVDNKWYGYPYGNNKCSKCIGTGMAPGSISAGKK